MSFSRKLLHCDNPVERAGHEIGPYTELSSFARKILVFQENGADEQYNSGTLSFLDATLASETESRGTFLRKWCKLNFRHKTNKAHCAGKEL